MRLAPYAHREIRLVVTCGSALALLAILLNGWLAVGVLLLTLAVLAFFRDPPRNSPDDPDVLLAPADGRVLVAESGAADADRAAALRVVIFLSIFDVHLTRSPCAGTVRRTTHRPGVWHNALTAQATTENECQSTEIMPSSPLPGPVYLRQIAGLIARRIVADMQTGQLLAAGQRVGMIKFGSQTEVCAPAAAEWRLLVRPGDRVRAGETPIARFEVKR